MEHTAIDTWNRMSKCCIYKMVKIQRFLRKADEITTSCRVRYNAGRDADTCLIKNCPVMLENPADDLRDGMPDIYPHG
jgi:hypothetical protein